MKFPPACLPYRKGVLNWNEDNLELEQSPHHGRAIAFASIAALKGLFKGSRVQGKTKTLELLNL
jgi:hypothetical protein